VRIVLFLSYLGDVFPPAKADIYLSFRILREADPLLFQEKGFHARGTRSTIFFVEFIKQSPLANFARFDLPAAAVLSRLPSRCYSAFRMALAPKRFESFP